MLHYQINSATIVKAMKSRVRKANRTCRPKIAEKSSDQISCWFVTPHCFCDFESRGCREWQVAPAHSPVFASSSSHGLFFRHPGDASGACKIRDGTQKVPGEETWQSVRMKKKKVGVAIAEAVPSASTA